MKIKSDRIIKSMLGEDFFENLEKSDIYKKYNNTATSLDEISTGLRIVPRAVMSYLISSLSAMGVEDNKELELPFQKGTFLHIVKKGQDIFSGYIYSDGKKINEFINRSIPGVGIVLMTTLELYDINDLKDNKVKEQESFDVNKLQDMIDERLRLHSLVSKVVDQKLAQRDAIEILVKEKLSQALKVKEQISEEEEEVEETKSEKLKKFLEQRNKRTSEAQIEKAEKINCPDCGGDLYTGGNVLSLCICYGEDWNKNIKIKKTENNMKIKFPKSMDKENIDMLLTTLKNINKE